MPLQNNRIKLLRRAAGMSQIEFARLFGAHQTAVSNWEKGKNSIDVSIADRIADYFKLPVEFVYGKPYVLTRSFGVWSEAQKKKYASAGSDEEKAYLEFIYGRGVFEGREYIDEDDDVKELNILEGIYGGDDEDDEDVNNLNIDSVSPLSCPPDEEEIKIALFGGDGEVTDEMWQDVKQYVEYIKSKKGKG